jgi:dTDP-4-dehydrorhamnose 3,5-epimerase-like enzyme
MAALIDPYIIQMNRIGESGIGYISVADHHNLPFVVKRTFWTYYTPESIVRGRHAHHQTQQLLVAVSGRITVNTEDAKGRIQTFVLDSPDQGLYIPPHVWHTMQYSHSAVQLVLASTEYDENDYIRSFDEFKKVWS